MGTAHIRSSESLTYRYTYANHKYAYRNPTSLVTLNRKRTFTGNIKIDGKKHVVVKGDGFQNIYSMVM